MAGIITENVNCWAGGAVRHKGGKPDHICRDCSHCYQPGHFKSQHPKLAETPVQAPAPTTLRITGSSTRKKNGTSFGRGRVFQLTTDGVKSVSDMVASHFYI